MEILHRLLASLRPQRTHQANHATLDSPIDGGVPVTFEGRAPLIVSVDAILCCFLIPAMRARQDITLPGGMSARLASNLPSLMHKLSEWDQGLSPVQVRGTICEKNKRKSSGVGCFFSGGVDSFFTLQRRSAEISHLILVQGFDIPLTRKGLWQRTSMMVGDVAGKLRKRPLILTSNIRELLDPAADWGTAHGAALATTAHLLAGTLGHTIIPSTYTKHQLHPWGTHPDLDHLWSGESMEIEHDTIEYTRIEKIEAIAGSPLAMKWLRVCWRNPEEEYNCGRCAKCIRTRIALRIVKAKCETMPSGIEVAEILQYDASDPVERFFAEELHDAAKGEVRTALEQVLS